MKWYYVVTIVVVSAAVGTLLGYQGYSMKHGCTVDKATGKSTCTK